MKKNTFIVRYRTFFLFAVLLSGSIFSCSESDKDVVRPETITDILLKNEQFSTLREIIEGVEMGDALRTDNLTLFAPNNLAFQMSGVTASSVLALPKDSALSFVKYHILGDEKKFADLKTGTTQALNKRMLTINKLADSTLQINRAYVTTKDLKAANGYIQVIDRLLTDN